MTTEEFYPYCCRAGANAAPGPCPWHDARVVALADYLTRRVGQAAIPIGTRVSVRSFKGAVGTVVGPDGHPKGSALAVRMDPPFPDGFGDGYACVSIEECTVVRPDGELLKAVDDLPRCHIQGEGGGWLEAVRVVDLYPILTAHLEKRGGA